MAFLLEILLEMQQEQEPPADIVIDEGARLIGDEAVIDSRSLVELLLLLEEFMQEQFKVAFDWTNDRAMSAKRSPFRTPLSLAEFAVVEAGL